jgi:hypothetical protein
MTVPDYVKPTHHYMAWNRKENLASLKSRGISVDVKLAAGKITRIVKGVMEGDHPPITRTKGGPVEDVKKCIDYITCIVSRVMQTVYTEEII